MIKFLENHEIDREAWDSCITASLSPLIYGYSFYLDWACPHWNALVDGHYERVMPLPARKRFGIPYLYQPLFTQQLGVFSKEKVSAEVMRQFILAIPARFMLVDLHLNYNNSESMPECTTRNSQVLLLKDPYSKLKTKYSESHKKNIRRATTAGIQVKAIKIEEFIELLQKDPSPYLNKTIVDTAANLADFAQGRGISQLLGAFDPTGKCISAALFIIYKSCAYLPFSATSVVGRENKAMFSMIDYFVAENAEKLEMLDFAGSCIKGVSEFNLGFGAIKRPYTALYVNRLPFPFSLMRKK